MVSAPFTTFFERRQTFCHGSPKHCSGWDRPGAAGWIKKNCCRIKERLEAEGSGWSIWEHQTKLAFPPSVIPTIELSRLLFVRIHPLQCLCDGLFVIPKSSAPPSHRSAPPCCWQQCGGAACWQRGSSFGQQSDVLCASPAARPPRSEGVQPICHSKGQAHLERRWRSGGYPSSQRLLCWLRSQTLGIAAFFPVLSAFQPTDNTWGMRSPFETEGDGQKSSWIDFPAGAVTLINILQCLFTCLFSLRGGMWLRRRCRGEGQICKL